MRWWRKRESREDVAQALPARGADENEFDYLSRLAAAHLPTEIASRWLAMLRPGIRLSPDQVGDVVLARLGGLPRVPAGFEWPTWDGHGPLSFVGEVDLDAVARSGLDLDIRLPSTGRLLGFYFDGSFDDFNGLVGTWDKESLAGARLLHLVAKTSECVEHPTPGGVLEFRPQTLSGQQVMTFPNWEHPVLKGEFGEPGQDHREWMTHPVNAEPFVEALWTFHVGPRHQIGGWADPVQGPVEFEVAQGVMDESLSFGDENHTAEALRWSLLIQIDSDDASDMMWGDVGMLYWLSRELPTVGDELGTVSFTWQCG